MQPRRCSRHAVAAGRPRRRRARPRGLHDRSVVPVQCVTNDACSPARPTRPTTSAALGRTATPRDARRGHRAGTARFDRVPSNGCSAQAAAASASWTEIASVPERTAGRAASPERSPRPHRRCGPTAAAGGHMRRGPRRPRRRRRPAATISASCSAQVRGVDLARRAMRRRSSAQRDDDGIGAARPQVCHGAVSRRARG